MAGVDRKGLVSASVYLIWTEPNSKVNRIRYKPLPFSIVCWEEEEEKGVWQKKLNGIYKPSRYKKRPEKKTFGVKMIQEKKIDVEDYI